MHGLIESMIVNDSMDQNSHPNLIVDMVMDRLPKAKVNGNFQYIAFTLFFFPAMQY